MNIQSFSKEITKQFRRHINNLNKRIRDKRIKISKPYLLPTAVRVIETPTLLIAELIGARNTNVDSIYSLTSLTPETSRSGTDYFSPGFLTPNPIKGIKITHHNNINGLVLTTKYEKSTFIDKCGIELPSTQIQLIDADTPLLIDADSDVICLQDISIIRASNQRVLFRYISSAVIFQNNHTIESIDDELKNYIFRLNPTFGLVTDSSLIPGSLARQIHSLADQPVKEKLLDRLLRENTDIFARALGRRSAKFQVHLEWQNKTPGMPTLSIPDFMLERDDGYFDILDVKKGLRKSKLTKNCPARPGFKSDVNDLISQLETYAEYFDSVENCIWAEKNYGIRIKNIKIIGVIGNYDSIDLDILERLKKRSPNLQLIDYNSLANMISRVSHYATA